MGFLPRWRQGARARAPAVTRVFTQFGVVYRARGLSRADDGQVERGDDRGSRSRRFATVDGLRVAPVPSMRLLGDDGWHCGDGGVVDLF